jgi:riboflavin kinase/FMN adenylyltransferase
MLSSTEVYPVSNVAQIITWQPGIKLPRGLAAFGVFDGLHLGHQHLISATIASARASGTNSIVLTFDKDPMSIVAPHIPLNKLMRDAQRIIALAQSAVDYVIVIPFDEAESKLSPSQFLQTLGLLDGSWYLDALHVGVNLRFGAHGSADVGELARLLPDTQVVAHKLLEFDGDAISASRIRLLLEAGEIAQANTLLGHDYTIEGTVVHGAERGRTIGFPTANISLDPNLVALADGVYAGYVSIARLPEHSKFATAISVGKAYTFGVETPTVEAFILDFDQYIYDQQVTLSITNKLRPMQKFANADALVAQLQADIAAVRALYKA